MFKVYGEQKDDHWLYEEQVARWKELDLTPGTFKEVDRLEKQLANIRKVLDLILSLAEELKKGTLDTVLAKTDEELGLEILENERPGPSFEQSGNRSEANPAGRQRVDLSPEQLQCASLIDEKVKKIIQTGGDNKKILTEMAAYFPEFMRLLKMSKPYEMNELIYRFDGFYHLAKTLEKLAAGIRSGDIKVPQI